MAARPLLFTVGHSNQECGKFIDLVLRHGITAIADVRFPIPLVPVSFQDAPASVLTRMPPPKWESVVLLASPVPA